MTKCKKCPIQDECRQMNKELEKRREEGLSYTTRKLTLCPLRVLADDVFSRYSQQVKRAE
ncbi:MAG: hypothetical protein HWN68_20125 [Desulfobacterales bacterium]|nr:hypothetical protein [Desulfobacterales bacterium]